jgi:hypothetical protein
MSVFIVMHALLAGARQLDTPGDREPLLELESVVVCCEPKRWLREPARGLQTLPNVKKKQKPTD